MATSLSLVNFLSFLLPRTPPPPSLPPLSSLPQKSKDNVTTKFSVLVAQEGRSGSALSPELSAVINPSFANANTLYYKSAYNVQVIVDDNEPEERLLNRFRREVMRAGVIQECKRRRFFENKQDEKKRKSREAAKRNRRRRPQLRSSSASNRQEPTTGKEDDDDEDNWEMPEVGLPY